MKFGAIIIGDEILSGKRKDGHLAKTIETLGARGLQLAWSHYLGDDPDLITATLKRTAAPETSLRDELEWLGWYLEIMRLRFGERLGIRQELEDGVSDLAVPRLILQPLVENALRHGAARRAGPATVTIVARRVGDRLLLSVMDDGPGVEDPEAALRKGVGLSNTAERLRALYGEAGIFSLTNRPEGGLTATIALPARVLEENAEAQSTQRSGAASSMSLA